MRIDTMGIGHSPRKQKKYTFICMKCCAQYKATQPPRRCECGHTHIAKMN
jgi:hypothetical protein